MTQVFGLDGVSLRARREGVVCLRESLAMDMLSEVLVVHSDKMPRSWSDVLERGLD